MSLIIENLKTAAGTFIVTCPQLEIQDGEYLVLLGPTGSGKTIFLETLTGFRSPDQGTIQLNDTDITGFPPESRSISLVHQDHLLFPHMNVRENIAFGLSCGGLDRGEIDQRVREIVEYLEIMHLTDRTVQSLSGGEKQMVCLARAVVNEPALLLMDEPLGATDPMKREDLEGKIRSLQSGLECPAIHVCHDFGEAARMADRIAVMISGRLCAIGSTETLFRTPPNIEVARFLGHENIYRITGHDQIVIHACDSLTDADSSSSLTLTVAGHRDDKDFALICAEDIEIIPSDRQEQPNDTNTFAGRILTVEEYGAYKKVRVDIGLRCAARLSPREVKDMNLIPGLEVRVHLAPENIHLF